MTPRTDGAPEPVPGFDELADASPVAQVVLEVGKSGEHVVAANAAARALLGREDLVGRSMATLTAGRDLARDPRAVDALLGGALVVLGRRHVLRRPDGATVTVDALGFVVGPSSEEVRVHVFLAEPARTAWMLRRARRDVEVISALSELRAALLGGERGDAMLRRICSATATLLAAENAGFLAFEEPGRARLIAAGAPALLRPGAVLELSDDAFGRALRSDRAERVTVSGERMHAATGAAGGVLVHSAVAPVTAGGTRLGSLTVRRRTAPFTDEELSALSVYARGAGEALTQVQRLAELERLRAREGIARDLHDESVQDLVAIRLGLSSLIAEVASPGLHGRLGELRDELDRVTKGLRDLLRELDADASSEEFGTAVHALARRRAGRVGMGWSVDLDDARVATLDQGLRAELLTVLNEGVSNAVRHSDGTQLDLALTVSGDRATLTVTDDGIGPGVAHRPGGRGLPSLRARAAQRGGGCTIGPGPGGVGTRVTWWVPTDETRGDAGL